MDNEVEEDRKLIKPGSALSDLPKALSVKISKSESPLLHARSPPSIGIDDITDDDVPEGTMVKIGGADPPITNDEFRESMLRGIGTFSTEEILDTEHPDLVGPLSPRSAAQSRLLEIAGAGKGFDLESDALVILQSEEILEDGALRSWRTANGSKASLPQLSQNGKSVSGANAAEYGNDPDLPASISVRIENGTDKDADQRRRRRRALSVQIGMEAYRQRKDTFERLGSLATTAEGEDVPHAIPVKVKRASTLAAGRDPRGGSPEAPSTVKSRRTRTKTTTIVTTTTTEDVEETIQTISPRSVHFQGPQSGVTYRL